MSVVWRSVQEVSGQAARKLPKAGKVATCKPRLRKSTKSLHGAPNHIQRYRCHQ